MKKTYALLLAFSLFICSCATEYITHPLYLNDVQYMWKPMASDSVRNNIYASGSLLVNTTDINGNSSGTSGLLNIYQSHTFKRAHLNLSYGAIGFLGSYRREASSRTNYSIGTIGGSTGTTITDPGFHQSFQGFGGNFSLSLFTADEDNVEWRPFGIDLTYTKEYGDFSRFRQMAINDDYVQYFPKNELFTYGIFSEVNIKKSESVRLAFKLGLNNSPGYPKRENNPFRELQNVSLNAGVGIKQMLFGLALKTTPTAYFLAPIGFQFNAGYRFR